MDSIRFNKLLASIVKSREILRNMVQACALEQAGFRNYAEQSGAPIVEAEDKKTNKITYVLHKHNTNLRK